MEDQVTFLEGSTINGDLPVAIAGQPHTSFPFTVYEEGTGRSLFGGTTMHLYGLAPPGCVAVAEPFIPNSYRKAGVVKIYPPAPFDGAVFNHDTDLWEEGRTFEQLRAKRWADLKQRRNELEAAGFIYRGQLLDSDPSSVLRMTVARAEAEDAVEEGDTSYEKVWICADNSPLALDAAGVIGMLPALAAYGTQLHDIAQGLRAAIGEAQTPAEVEAISWPI